MDLGEETSEVFYNESAALEIPTPAKISAINRSNSIIKDINQSCARFYTKHNPNNYTLLDESTKGGVELGGDAYTDNAIDLKSSEENINNNSSSTARFSSDDKGIRFMLSPLSGLSISSDSAAVSRNSASAYYHSDVSSSAESLRGSKRLSEADLADISENENRYFSNISSTVGGEIRACSRADNSTAAEPEAVHSFNLAHAVVRFLFHSFLLLSIV